MPQTIWDRVGDNLAKLRMAGIMVPLADVIQATIAIEGDHEMWVHDTHFDLKKRALPQLKMFKEPS